MNLTVSAAPHIRSNETTRKIMLDVLIALAPAMIAAVIFFGVRALVLTAISAAACVACDALMGLVLRRKADCVGDLSAVVTGVLLAFSLPVSCPYWVVIIGDAFAIIVVKGLVGGLGQNVFNPALGGRAFVMLFWPAAVTRFSLDAVSAAAFGSVDIVASSTPLQTMSRSVLPEASLLDMFIGNIGGCIGEVCTLALLIGFAWLLYRGVISWRIPAAYVGAVAVLTLIFYRGDNALAWMLYSVMGGGVMLGAIFMATDYATSPTVPAAQIAYGLGCGVLTVVIRYFGIFPEGVTYAILIMNAFAWALDKAMPVRRFGVMKGGAGK